MKHGGLIADKLASERDASGGGRPQVLYVLCQFPEDACRRSIARQEDRNERARTRTCEISVILGAVTQPE